MSPARKSPLRWECIGVRTGHPVHADSLSADQQQAVIVDLGRSRKRSRGPVPRREAELQVVLDETTGQARWVGLWHDGGLTASDLQRFPWARYLNVADSAARGLAEPAFDETGQLIWGPDQAKASFAWFAELDDLMSADALDKPVKRRRPKIAKRPGRGGHPDAHYLAVAKRYRELYSKGVSSPTATIGREWKVSRDTAAGWVMSARKRGHLPPARPGRAG